ncbi:MAG: dTDP-4-dehydrorhamnose reductase [Steroidobacteraceae bacterium]
MKVLLAGASGQLGRALLSSKPSDMDVIVPLRSDLDLLDARRISAEIRRHKPHLVINAAAFTAVDRAESERDTAFRVNADGPQHLASAADEAGARLVQISTDYVFDGKSAVPYAPDARPNPLSVYGASKLAGEQRVLQTLGSRAVVLRTSWLYAAHGSNFLLTMLRVMAERRSVRVVTDQIGTPTAAASVAGAIWLIARRPEVRGIQHWTDSGVASWYDFAVAIAEEASLVGLIPEGVEVQPIGTDDYPTPARRPSYSVLDKRLSIASLQRVPAHWRVSLRSVLREISRA